MIENDVGRGKYETWPTGATRAIESLEAQLSDACGCFDALDKVFSQLEARFKVLVKEGEDPAEIAKTMIPDPIKDNGLWKAVKDAHEMVENSKKRFHPGKRVV